MLLLGALLPLARAGATSDDRHGWSHPLADGDVEAAQDLLAAGWSAEEVLGEVAVGMQHQELEDGTVRHWAGARRVEREGVHTADEAEEPAVEAAVAIDPDIALLLAAADELGGEVFPLTLLLREPDALADVRTFGRARLEAILEGNVRSYADEALLREELGFRREDAWAPALATVVDCVERAGGYVSALSEASGSVEVEVPEWALEAVSGCAGVGSVLPAAGDAVDDSYSWSAADSAAGTRINGDELEDLLQTRVFYRHATEVYDGAGEHAGLTGNWGHQMLVRHEGFGDASFADRVENCTWSTVFNSCSHPTPDPGKQHATASASALVGDITAGQDPAVTDEQERRERSGVARGATLVGIDDVRYITEDFFLDADFGTDAWSRTVNTVFESGVAWFKSASNAGHSSATDCTVGSPGSAIGAFTVGTYNLASGGSSSDVDSDQSRGGTSSEGRGRAIIALSTPNPVEFPYQSNGSLSCDYGTNWGDPPSSCDGTFPETSAATPLAAGAALVFREWFLDNEGSAIDDPALLYAFMLLMGDRWQDDTRASDWSHLTGAGRLRLRAFDSLGMDSPWGWGYDEVCVIDGLTNTMTLTGNLNASVDVFRVVAWWYDARHDDTTPVDNAQVEMRLQFGTSFTRSDTTDNRQRIQRTTGLSGNSAVLKLEGLDVSSDYAGCGVNGIPVTYAWFYESSAHNDTSLDADGVNPLGYIRVEE